MTVLSGLISLTTNIQFDNHLCVNLSLKNKRKKYCYLTGLPKNLESWKNLELDNFS